MVAILGYSREQIFTAVKGMYSAVAERPESDFHFPVGDAACRLLGYPPEQIAELPAPLRKSFAGVGYPFHADAINLGDTVLDIGAGAGTDAMIASQVVGNVGQVVAMDLTPAMTRKLRHTVTEAGIANVDVVQATAERIPLSDGSVDSITSNGVLNLVPNKRQAVAEMFRVLRPHGQLQIADVVIDRPVSVDCHTDPRLWVECVVGATVEDDFLMLFRDAGFENVRVLRRLDYFSHSPSEQTREVAASFGARSVEVTMRRGPQAPTRATQFFRRINPVRLLASLWRRGFMGVASMAMAVLACYGTLAALGLLALLGMSLALDETIWAGAIAAFSVLTVLAIAPGVLQHRAFGPAALAVAGAGAILYAVLANYNALVELAGFILLGGSVWWDIRLRRREEARILGLTRNGN
ncbi:MAG: MerC family mercury resistance protein [Aquisalimonadaceae bacterium]